MPDFQQFANALAGFGAGIQGQGPQFLQGLREQQSNEALKQLGGELASGNIDQGEYLKRLGATNPEIYSKMALSQFGIDQPADVKSWMYRNNLPPERQAEFDQFRRAPQWLNAGGSFVNPNTGGAIPVTPKPEELPDFKKNQAAATTAGNLESKTITEAKAGLPEFLATANNQLSIIDQMIGNKEMKIPEHPGLNKSVGSIDARIPSFSDEAVDFNALLEQARSGAFLDSIVRLQGYGALSNEEGKAATAAATRMKSLSSEEGFKKAAKEYRNIITQGIKRMQKKASLDVGTPSAFDQPQESNGGGVNSPKSIDQLLDMYAPK